MQLRHCMSKYTENQRIMYFIWKIKYMLNIILNSFGIFWSILLQKIGGSFEGLLSHINGLVCRPEEAVRHFEDFFRHFEAPVRRSDEAFRPIEDLFLHIEDVFLRIEVILRHIEAVSDPGKLVRNGGD